MCNPQCLDFGRKWLTEDVVKGENILEVGSRNINGTLREHCKDLGCNAYVGIDIVQEAGVDIVCDVCNTELLESLTVNARVVVCTEVLEHVEDWRLAVSNMKTVLNEGGYILITTRSKGFGYHSYPHDYWRYEVEDMKKIFSDFEIISIEKDVEKEPGVFVFARKPIGFKHNDLSQIELYKVKETEQ